MSRTAHVCWLLLVGCGASAPPSAHGSAAGNSAAVATEVARLERENEQLRGRLAQATRSADERSALLALARSEARDAREEARREAQALIERSGHQQEAARMRRDSTGDGPVAVITFDGRASEGSSFAGVTERLPVAPLPVAPAAANVQPVGSAQGSPPASAPPAADPVLAQYRAALALVRDRRFAEAIAALTAFLRQNATHAYADNALFWRAESYYAQAHYVLALSDFEEVIARYPDGNKVPDALLKIGHCHARLGDLEQARSNFERLRANYPASAAARSLPEEVP